MPGTTRSWKVYGRGGHRQKASFSESVYWDFSSKNDGIRILEFINADKTGTHDYTIARITRNNAQECASELGGQITDGYFEDVYVGDVVEIDNNDVPLML